MTRFGLLLVVLSLHAGIVPDVELPVAPDITRLLPDSSDLAPYKPFAPPHRYVGEDLYQLINGGAVVYYEYGFSQVVTQEFETPDGQRMYLELYEMTSAAAAFGIFTFKTEKTGENVPIGNEAILEDYYLNFWKGNYLATISAHNRDSDNKDALLTIAHALELKITNTGTKPELMELFPEEDDSLLDVEYVKGSVVLSNHYNFGSEDIFGINECAIAEFEDYRIFVFKYRDETESLSWFTQAKNNLKEPDQSEEVIDLFGIFSFKDGNGNSVYCKLYQNYIFVHIGTKEHAPETNLEKIIKNIR